MSKVLRETPPITEKDCFYIVERHKSEFMYPIHSHQEYELNFVEHGRGVHRVVGDSIEEIGPYDLVLVTGNGLEHAWQQGNCTEPDVREITIQFSSSLLDEKLLGRTQFYTIRKMFERARHGVAFSSRETWLVASLRKKRRKWTVFPSERSFAACSTACICSWKPSDGQVTVTKV